MFYYEVQILQGEFSSYGTQVFGHIGPQSNSWRYHSSGRFSIGNGDMIGAFGPAYEAGDIVGCGVDFYNRRIFFTQNAVLLGIVSTDSIGISLSTELCPAVGLASGFSDISIVANFDCTPLFWESLSSCYTKRLAALNTEARLNVGKPFFVAATRWRAKHRHNSIEVSHDGRDIRKIRPHSLSDTTAVSARGDSITVFEDGVSYYEVEIVDLAVDGFADPWTETWDHAIGVLKGTWGYHSNGKVYEGSPYADRFAPTFQGE
ncbi:hypothetical protein PHLCEN_2v11863 [Hermanssonia centrifuga]|uniref:B30.2/SPRY domain-containing protein n=1 Tax=Hermanssonia centrifuga TaxID=98765 RepID=A0A2R6NIZ3_9APHY|nr:hypothetical protein PHLCEN_2v11863 [Hermanssonia centrifuga]